MPASLSITPPSLRQSDTPPPCLHPSPPLHHLAASLTLHHHHSTTPPPCLHPSPPLLHLAVILTLHHYTTTPAPCLQLSPPRSPTPPSLSHHSPSLLHHSSLSSGTATSTRCILNCTDHKAEGGSSPSSLRWQRCRFGKPYLLCLRLRKAGTGTGVSSSLVPRRVFLDIV